MISNLKVAAKTIVYALIGFVGLAYPQGGDEGLDDESSYSSCFPVVFEGKTCNRTVSRLVPRSAKKVRVRLKNQVVFMPSDSTGGEVSLTDVSVNPKTATVNLFYNINDVPERKTFLKTHVIGQTRFGDVDRSGEVDEQDLEYVLESFGEEVVSCDPEVNPDTNADGKVDDTDLLKVLFEMGKESELCILTLRLRRL